MIATIKSRFFKNFFLLQFFLIFCCFLYIVIYCMYCIVVYSWHSKKTLQYMQSKIIFFFSLLKVNTSMSFKPVEITNEKRKNAKKINEVQNVKVLLSNMQFLFNFYFHDDDSVFSVYPTCFHGDISIQCDTWKEHFNSRKKNCLWLLKNTFFVLSLSLEFSERSNSFKQLNFRNIKCTLGQMTFWAKILQNKRILENCNK